MKKYLIGVTYIPLMCNSITKNIVISEEVSKFLLKNLKEIKQKNNEDNILINFCKEISENDYKELKTFNPTNEGYFKLLNRDYSKFYK